MRGPATNYARVDGAEVAYQVVGDGPVDLVYHHGMCHLDLQWDAEPEAAFNERLASFSRLLLFDRRGSGASARLANGFFPSADDWAADLLAVLDAAGSEQAAIFAEAEAGPTAIRFAARHPERVTALVLGNTLPRYLPAPGYEVAPPEELLDGFVAAVAAGWGTADLMALTFPRLSDEATHALARLCRAAATPSMAVALYRHVWQELDVRDDLAAVSVPTLVLRNRNAFVTGGAEYLAEHIPGAQLVDVDDDEGLFFTGDFGPVIDEVATFLTGRPVDVGVSAHPHHGALHRHRRVDAAGGRRGGHPVAGPPGRARPGGARRAGALRRGRGQHHRRRLRGPLRQPGPGHPLRTGDGRVPGGTRPADPSRHPHG